MRSAQIDPALGALDQDLSGAVVEVTSTESAHTEQTIPTVQTVETPTKPAAAARGSSYQGMLVEEQFEKVAKRSKAYLLAITEQAKIEPKQRQVQRAVDSIDTIIDLDLLSEIKVTYRQPHLFGKADVNDFLELLAEAIYDGVGKARTETFTTDNKLEKLFLPMYPIDRLHFDYKHIVSNARTDEIIDELANQKARNLAVKLVSEKIVSKLS